jgi:peptidoglycan hydrolase-like protein with peptidoglycan-binding domain
VDGRFDRGTENALRAFQAAYGLPVTGEVDLPTWERLREVYGLYVSANTVPSAITPFWSPDLRVGPGDGGGLVRIVQILLDELRMFYDSFGEVPVSGVYDEATAGAVRAFQRANLLDETGVVDALTWNRLAGEYNIAVREDP